MAKNNDTLLFLFLARVVVQLGSKDGCRIFY